MIYALYESVAQVAPTNKIKTPPPQMVSSHNLVWDCGPREESNSRWNLRLPNTLPMKALVPDRHEKGVKAADLVIVLPIEAPAQHIYVRPHRWK